MNDQVLLLGIGNEILGDDGVGIRIGEYFEKYKSEKLTVTYAGIGGIGLLDRIMNFSVVVIVDALEVKKESVSDYGIQVYEEQEIIDQSLIFNSHDISLGMGLKLARDIFPETLPNKIKFVAIEIPFQYEYRNNLSEHTKKLFQKALFIIRGLLKEADVELKE